MTNILSTTPYPSLDTPFMAIGYHEAKLDIRNYTICITTLNEHAVFVDVHLRYAFTDTRISCPPGMVPPLLYYFHKLNSTAIDITKEITRSEFEEKVSDIISKDILDLSQADFCYIAILANKVYDEWRK